MADADRTQGAPAIPVIGLVGGVGAGKSMVAAILADLGAEVVDADRLAHDALEESGVRSALLEWWGPAVLDSADRVDRRELARRVFSDATARRRLEGLIHPMVKARTRAVLADARRRGDVRALVVDAPLLIEAGMDAELCDAVIFVDAESSVRQVRTKERRGWSTEEHVRREQAQESLDLKRIRADYVVNNNSTPDALREEVARVFAKILSTCSASARP